MEAAPEQSKGQLGTPSLEPEETPMGASPRRRAIKLIDTQLRDIAREFTRQAPEMELGWSQLKADLADVGWPARTPDDDRADRQPSTRPPDPENISVIDYLDPTGDNAAGIAAMHDDLEALQDHRHVIETSIRAISLIAARHRPPATPAVPACSVSQCGEAVEMRKLVGDKHSYVGMEQIAGVWVGKAGKDEPRCGKHRKRDERDVA